MTSHRKLAAILAADVVGYSRLMADDERATIETINAYREIIRKHVRAHEGRVVDTPGDALLAEFPSAVEGVQCAVETQQELARRNAQLAEHRRMQFRIGINLGDVIEEGGALYGDGVNVAARLEALADTGGICIAGTAFDQVEGKLPLIFKFIGEQQVKNIPKPVRAYSWIAQPGPAAAPNPARARWLLTSLVATLLVGVAAFAWWYTRTPVGSATAVASFAARQGTAPERLADRPRVAILPLANISPSAEDEYFSDGMTEELISRLSRLDGLDVIARTSVMQYKGKATTVADIGRELSVSTVLEGSVRKVGKKVRITVQLIDVATQGHLWSADYDRELKDVFVTQSEISERVASALHVRLAKTDPGALPNRGSTDLETYNLYLMGRYHWSKTTLDGLKESIKYFEQAIARSPNDARAWAGLADAYVWLGYWTFATPSETFPKAKAAAQKALALDENLPEAHASLGLVRFMFEWDWAGAEQSFKRAIELSPSFAMAHLWYALYFKAARKMDQSAAEVMRANELDPLSLIANAEIGWVSIYRRDFRGGERACRKTLEMDRDHMFALQCLVYALGVQEKPEAIAVAKRLVALAPGDPYMLGVLGWAHGVVGEREQAQQILAELQQQSKAAPLPAPSTFWVYLGLRDRDHAMRDLETMQRERWTDVLWANTGPEFDPLRSDPRFDAFLRRMRFPD